MNFEEMEREIETSMLKSQKNKGQRSGKTAKFERDNNFAIAIIPTWCGLLQACVRKKFCYTFTMNLLEKVAAAAFSLQGLYSKNKNSI